MVINGLSGLVLASSKGSLSALQALFVVHSRHLQQNPAVVEVENAARDESPLRALQAPSTRIC